MPPEGTANVASRYRRLSTASAINRRFHKVIPTHSQVNAPIHEAISCGNIDMTCVYVHHCANVRCYRPGTHSAPSRQRMTLLEEARQTSASTLATDSPIEKATRISCIDNRHKRRFQIPTTNLKRPGCGRELLEVTDRSSKPPQISQNLSHFAPGSTHKFANPA